MKDLIQAIDQISKELWNSGGLEVTSTEVKYSDAIHKIKALVIAEQERIIQALSSVMDDTKMHLSRDDDPINRLVYETHLKAFEACFKIIKGEKP